MKSIRITHSLVAYNGMGWDLAQLAIDSIRTVTGRQKGLFVIVATKDFKEEQYHEVVWLRFGEDMKLSELAKLENDGYEINPHLIEQMAILQLKQKGKIAYAVPA